MPNNEKNTVTIYHFSNGENETVYIDDEGSDPEEIRRPGWRLEGITEAVLSGQSCERLPTNRFLEMEV